MRIDDVGVSILFSDVSDPNLKLEQPNRTYWTLDPATNDAHLLHVFVLRLSPTPILATVLPSPFCVRACRATIASARLPLPSYEVWNAPHFNRHRSPVRPVVAHAEESRSDALSRLVSAHVHIEHTIRHGTSYWASRGRVSESLRAGSQEYVRLSNIAVDRLPSTVRSRPSVPSYVR